MWVPEPTSLVLIGPRAWPGKAMDEFDIVLQVVLSIDHA